MSTIVLRGEQAHPAALVCLFAITVANHAPILHLRFWEPAVYVSCMIAGMVLRLPRVIHASLIFVLISVIAFTPTLRETIGSWPVIPLLIPLLAASVTVAAVPSTRRALGWLRLGRVTRRMWLIAIATGLASAGALIAWAAWARDLGLAERIAAELADTARVPLVLIGIPVFAVANATTEEAIFRGVLLGAWLESSRARWPAMLAQAASFAALHYQMGFPNGSVGYLMVFCYALVLGAIRLQTSGLMAPIAVHVISDLVIGYIVVARVVM